MGDLEIILFFFLLDDLDGAEHFLFFPERVTGPSCGEAPMSITGASGSTEDGVLKVSDSEDSSTDIGGAGIKTNTAGTSQVEDPQ